MSTLNDNNISNESGKNRNLGPNANDDSSLLFHRVVFGIEPITACGPSSAFTSSPDGFTTYPADSPSPISNANVATGLPASLSFTPINSNDAPAEGNNEPWTDADDDALRALLIEANRNMTVGGGETELSTKISDPVELYWLFSQCRTMQGREAVWIKTENVDWEKVSRDYFSEYGVKIHPERLKLQVDTTFSTIGVEPTSNTIAAPQVQVGPLRAARKRRSVFAIEDNVKRIRNIASPTSVSASRAVGRLTIEDNLDPAPVRSMHFQDSEMVYGGECGQLEEETIREDGHTKDELDGAAGLLRLSACNYSHEQWAIEALLDLGRCLKWSLPSQPKGECQIKGQQIFKIVVAGPIENLGGLQPMYMQRARHYMSNTSGNGVAKRNRAVLIDREQDIVATLRDAPLEKRILIVSDSGYHAFFLYLLLERIQEGICIPGTSTWPTAEGKFFPLMEELLRRVKSGQKIKFGGVVNGRRMMTSPFSFGRLGVVHFETLDVVVQAASG